MIKLCELSRKLLSHDLPANRYMLQLLATITALSDDELRAFARIILHNADPTP